HDKYECANLAAHMRLFYEKKGFHLPYCFETDTPLLWWSTNYTDAKSVGKLAIKLFSITPHSADCKRTFSSLGCCMENEKELVFFGKKLSYNDLQEQVKSATFLVEDDEGIIEDEEDITDDPEEDVVEYDSEIIEHFDIENIVFLRDEMFQDSESDIDSEESQSDRSDEFNEDEMDVNNKIGQGEFDFDPTDLAADFMKEWSDERVDNTIGTPIQLLVFSTILASSFLKKAQTIIRKIQEIGVMFSFVFHYTGAQ
ncbi:5585_t:CDS:2, partial [Gigaspora rosea]